MYFCLGSLFVIMGMVYTPLVVSVRDVDDRSSSEFSPCSALLSMHTVPLACELTVFFVTFMGLIWVNACYKLKRTKLAIVGGMCAAAMGFLLHLSAMIYITVQKRRHRGCKDEMLMECLEAAEICGWLASQLYILFIAVWVGICTSKRCCYRVETA